MKKIITLVAAALLCFCFTACAKEVNVGYGDAETRNAARALSLGKSTLNAYLDWDAYREEDEELWEVFLGGAYDPYKQVMSGVASVWHYTSVMAMTNRLLAISPEGEERDFYEKMNADLIKELAFYRGSAMITNYNGSKAVKMYGVNRSESGREKAAVAGKESVYDDQMWLIREFLSAYRNTDNEAYFAEAVRLADVCLDGWDVSKDAQGNEYGGITWGSHYDSKHTCSNAPIVSPLVKISELYKQKGDNDKSAYYLEWAKKVYDFTYANLKNADDTYGDAFWSDREVRDDKPEIGNYYVTTNFKKNYDPKAYTYNTGAMISGGADLYRATVEQRYLTEAERSAEAAFHVFAEKRVIDGKTYYLYPNTSTLWFNLVLLTGFIDLYPYAKTQCAQYIESFQTSLDYAYDHYYLNGSLPRNYLDGWAYGSDFDIKKDVMDSAANAEMYAMLAQFEASKKTANA